MCVGVLDYCFSAKSELDDEHFMTFHHFPDTQTLKLVGAVSEVLGGLRYYP